MTIRMVMMTIIMAIMMIVMRIIKLMKNRCVKNNDKIVVISDNNDKHDYEIIT